MIESSRSLIVAQQFLHLPLNLGNGLYRHSIFIGGFAFCVAGAFASASFLALRIIYYTCAVNKSAIALRNVIDSSLSPQALPKLLHDSQTR